MNFKLKKKTKYFYRPFSSYKIFINMSTQFLSKLSQNYIELLEDDEYYDVTIKVGKDHNIKTYRAHMNILCYRSPYLRRTLVSKKKNVKLPNISPEIFQVILKYIYGGILSLDDQTTSDIIKVLAAADVLQLQELIDYLQKYLIKDKSEWMEQHFKLIYQTSFQSNNLLDLQIFCTNLMVISPKKVFCSLGFTSLTEKSLVQLIKRDDLQMKEVEIWERVLKWGIAKNSTLIPDPETWTDDDFKTMKDTLQRCLPLIRFFNLSSKEFLEKVRPYEKLLNRKLYDELLSSHLDPDSKPNNDYLPSIRGREIDELCLDDLDSKIVDLNIISLFSKWVDKMDINTHTNKLYLPYEFVLLLRGTRDGFTPKKFHTLCDGKHNTVTFIKVKGTEEILGGYNPITWMNSFNAFGEIGKTKDSFIFSFKNKYNFFNDAIFSKVKDAKHAIYYRNKNGPHFGSDIIMYSFDETTDYETIYCRKDAYEKKIRDTENLISIEDYEVFQIRK